MCEIRMIVTDMDGTFLGANGELIEENCQELVRAEQKGIIIAFASGRIPAVLNRIARNAGLHSCRLIGLNGAYIKKMPGDETLLIEPIPQCLFTECLRILNDNACFFNVYTDRGVYTNRLMSEEARKRFEKNFEGRDCRVVVGRDAISCAMGEIPLKIMVHCTFNPEGSEIAKRKIACFERLQITTAKAGSFEILTDKMDKARAVCMIAEEENIPLSQVMAFGDYDNDIGMLQECGYSFAMGNATDSVLRSARYITTININGGVAMGIRRFIH